MLQESNPEEKTFKTGDTNVPSTSSEKPSQ